MRCIWCLQEHSEPSIEHVIPKAIGCPEDLVLRNGEVCQPCNNRLGAVVDRRLVHNFEAMLAMLALAGQHRMPAKRIPLSGIGNLQITDTPDGPHVAINMGSKAIVDQAGTRVGPLRRDRRHAEASFKDLGNGKAQITVRLKTVHDEVFSRGLHKIALGLVVCKGGGVEIAFSPRFDAVRDHVARGIGTRRVLLARSTNEPSFQAQAIQVDRAGGYFAEFALVGSVFYVDLTAAQTISPRIEANLRRLVGTEYTWTPLVRDASAV